VSAPGSGGAADNTGGAPGGGARASEGESVVILGGACAGYTAAIYTARAQLDPLLFAGPLDGGQLSQTTEVENYPGFPEGVMGPELMQSFRKQAEKFGTRIRSGAVTAVDFSVRPFRLTATGATARWLGLPSEDRLKGRGVSACATCDGFFFRNKEIAVVGGGDSALEEAFFLTRFASRVTIIHRRDSLRASRAMQERARANPKMAFLWDSAVEDVLGESRVEGLRVRNLKTGAVADMPFQGLFLGIGHEPNTAIFRGQLEMDGHGYIACKRFTETSVGGVFAAGDVRDSRYRQAIVAAGSGCQAALDAEKYLAEQG
jgi:thioredoxin reductase (NADPH)